MRVLLSGVITGPIWTPSSSPLPTFRSRRRIPAMASVKRLRRFADGDGYRNGEAPLASAAEGAVADDLGAHFEIGIGQDDHMVLRATLALHALTVGRAFRVDIFGDGRGANEANSANVGMV